MTIVESYHAFAEAVLGASGMTDKMLHMHIGMALYLGAKVVLRTRRASIYALAFVCIMELANEIADALFFGALRWDDTRGDMLATLFWPTMDFAISRYRRARWSQAQARGRLWQPLALPAGVRGASHASAA